MKAFQYIYAYHQCRNANQQRSKDLIDDIFKPDLMAEVPMDKQILEKNTINSYLLFDEKLKPGKEALRFENECHQAADKAWRHYLELNIQDKKHLLKELISETEAVSDRYLMILQLVFEIKKLIIEESENKELEALRGENNFPERKYLTNKALAYLANNEHLKKTLNNQFKAWESYPDVIHSFYQELKKNDTFKAYTKNLVPPTFEEDLLLISFILKEFAFQNPGLMAFFDDQDINWIDNKASIKSMVSKTIKLISENEPNANIVTQLSADWEEDKAFLINLFNTTLDNEKKYLEIIEPKLKNWDMERLADADEIIIKMALMEFLNLNAVPVKVTINEYIEVAKHYSTPKSKQFVNGMLDKLSGDLTKEGLIKKSGRGLL